MFPAKIKKELIKKAWKNLSPVHHSVVTQVHPQQKKRQNKGNKSNVDELHR